MKKSSRRDTSNEVTKKSFARDTNILYLYLYCFY